MARVVVVGSLNIDLAAFCERLPSPGETLLAQRLQRNAGGKGLNQAIAAARAGVEVALVGIVGDDGDGVAVVREAKAAGVDVAGVGRAEGTPTGCALITVDGRGEDTIVVAAGANATLSEASVEAVESTIAAADVVVTQLEIPLATVWATLLAARRHQTVTILNASPTPPDVASDAIPPGVYSTVDVLVGNYAEVCGLAASLDPGSGGDGDSAAVTLLDSGVGAVVVTRGERGATWIDANRAVHHADRFSVDAIDGTAAGDAFCGTLAASLAEGRSITESLRRSSAAGALAATVRGAVPSLPYRAAVDELLASARRSG
jgi:ribokinase